MQRALWVCSVAVVTALGCGGDSHRPSPDAGGDSSMAGSSAGNGATGGSAGTGGISGTGGNSGTGGDSEDAGALDGAVDSGPLCSCPAPQTCDGDAGACVCPAGFADAGGSGGAVCVDIDECVSGNACDANAVCTNSEGAYACTCGLGFVGDGFTCEDACVVALATTCTDANAVCTKPEGAAVCRCAAGYIDANPSVPGSDCDPDPICMMLNCDPLAACDSTAATPRCDCPAGYSDTNGDGTACQDIDECATDTDDCSSDAACANTAGSFVCTCNGGFFGDGRNCTACDAIADCGSNLNCTSSSDEICGSCAAGFVGDGTATCTACATGTYDLSNTCVDCGTIANCTTVETCSASDGTGLSCATCASGYRGNGTATCTACRAIANCESGLTCTTANNQTCATCAAGFVGDGTGTCAACATGLYDNNNVCSDCGTIPNCGVVETCSATDGSGLTCPTCNAGFRGNGTGTCTACAAIANCTSGLSCTTANNQTCGACAPGHVGDGTGTCTACTAGNYDNNNVCTDCGTIANCAVTETCNVTNGNNLVCPTCSPGFRGNGTGACTACTAIANCASGLTCTTAGNQTCGTCAAGYIGDGTGTCTRCATGTYDNNNACTDCGTIANCAVTETCNINTGSGLICPTCAPGFRGNGTGTCTACAPIANCASGLTCTTSGNQTCATCAAGYVGDGTGTCTRCAAGTFDNNNVCTDCGTIANCAVTETCNVTTGNGDICPTCATGYSGSGTAACTDINECASPLTHTCDTSPNACINDPGSYHCQCPVNYNDVNDDGSDCLLACTNCDANADCVQTAPSTYQCQCDASENFVGNGTSCRCDLSGKWAVRVAISVEWSAVSVGFFNFTRAGTATLYSYEIRTLDYDGNTLDMDILPCGGTDADLCGTGVWNNRAFGQTINQSVWDSFATNQPQFSMTLANAVPTTPFTTSNAAVFLGMRFNGQNDLTYWPSNGSPTANIVFDDPVNAPADDGIGVESNVKLTGTGTTQCGASHYYSRWPNLDNGNAFELTAFRSGSRSISRFAGSVISCNEIGGLLLGPDRDPMNTIDVPRVDGRIAGCTVTPTTNPMTPRPCTSDEVLALNNNQYPNGVYTKAQRVTGAQFSMVRVGNSATCTTALNATYPTY